jgi:hypothetical protein
MKCWCGGGDLVVVVVVVVVMVVTVVVVVVVLVVVVVVAEAVPSRSSEWEARPASTYAHGSRPRSRRAKHSGLGNSPEQTLSSTRTRLLQTGASYYLAFAGIKRKENAH